MKKKGLIISTVVMVVVLIASLTTATYAWFSATAVTTIDEIKFSVGTGSDVSIGLSKTNTFVDGTPGGGSFVSGSTSIGKTFGTMDDTTNKWNATGAQWGTGYWEGTDGLGSRINMQLNMSNLEKAVGTGMVGGTADKTFAITAVRTLASSTATGMIISEGNSEGATKNGATIAYGQKDYLDVVIGVQAAAADLYSIICNVTINPDAGNIDLGMNAAIHMAWKVGGMIDGTSENYDIYQGNRSNSTLATLGYTLCDNKRNTADFGGQATQTLNPGAINKAITVHETATPGEGERPFISRNDIYQIHLMIWIDGNDPDCTDQTKGVGSTIYINFSTTHKERTNPAA